MAWIQKRSRRPAKTWNFSQATLVFVVWRPAWSSLCSALLWLLGWVPSRTRALQGNGRDVFRLGFRRSPRSSGRSASTGRRAVIVVAFGNWFAVHDYHFPLVLMADRLSLPFLGMTAGAVGTDRAVLGDLPASRARLSAVLPAAAPFRVRIFAGIRRRFVRPAGGRMGMVGITSVLLIAFFQQRPAPVENGLRVFAVYRACDIGLLVGGVRHAPLGRNGFVCRRPSPADRSAAVDRLPASAAGGGRKSGAGSVLGMASARHGRPHAIERDILRRDLDSRRRVSPAPRSADAGPVRDWLPLW